MIHEYEWNHFKEIRHAEERIYIYIHAPRILSAQSHDSHRSSERAAIRSPGSSRQSCTGGMNSNLQLAIYKGSFVHYNWIGVFEHCDPVLLD